MAVDGRETWMLFVGDIDEGNGQLTAPGRLTEIKFGEGGLEVCLQAGVIIVQVGQGAAANRGRGEKRRQK